MTQDKVAEYRKRLERHAEDKTVLKDTLYKLNKIDVTVDILQTTGICKAVNGLRKKDGSVGTMATDLIRKWRTIVGAEDENHSNSKSSSNNNSHSHKSSSDKHNRDSKHESHRSSKSEKSSSHSKSSSHKTSSHNQTSSAEPELFSEHHAVARSHSSSKESSSKSHHGSHHSSKHKSEHSEKKSRSESSSHHESSKSSHKKPEKETKPSVEKHSPSKTVTIKVEKEEKPSSSEKPGKKRIKPEDEEEQGFDNNFASFEACLGMNDPIVSKKKKMKLLTQTLAATAGKSMSVNKGSSPKMTVTSSTLNGAAVKPKGPRLPDLLQKKPQSSISADDITGSLEMPALVTDYKPLPRLEKAPQKRALTNEEAVMFTTSRKDRTAVYSGRRNVTLTSVPSLYEACVRVLIDNVEFIEETGGVPFEILKPILDRCTWQQLYNLEYFNPYLVEDSDPLWEAHSRRDFRGKQPARGEETWRELYLRCHDEREQKFKSLTASISASMKEKTAPVRTTKLAYVDSMAKAPRNVQRQQLKNGPSFLVKKGPSNARSIATSSATSAATESVRAPPSGGGSTSSMRKPRMAPLMAKTMSFLKTRRTIGYGFSSR